MSKCMDFMRLHLKELLVTFVLVYFSNDTLLFGTNSNKIMFWFQFIALGLLLLWLLFNTKNINSRNLIILLLFIGCAFLTFFLNMDLSVKYVYEIMMVVLSILIVQSISFKKFKFGFCFWIEILCIFAVIMFFLALFLPFFISHLPYIINESGYKYHFMLLGFCEEIGFSDLPRVYGVFREPGVFMVYIILGIIFETIMSTKFSVRRIIVYVIGALITFSTAAYILLFVTLIVVFINRFFTRKTKNKKSFKKTLLLFIFAFACGIVFINLIGFEQINAFVFNKMRVSNQSFDSRVGSIYGNLNMFKLKPMFGNGFTFFERNFTYFASLSGFTEAHNTNTFLKVLSVHGIVYFLLLIVGAFLTIKKNCGSIVVSLLIFLIYIAIFSNEDLMVNTIIYVLSFYGICKTKKDFIFDRTTFNKENLYVQNLVL